MQPLEDGRTAKRLDEQDRIRGQLDHVDLRRTLPDPVTLDRVVVEKRDRVEADVELVRNGPEVRGLVVPVDANGGKVGGP